MNNIIRVSANSLTTSVAGAIAGVIRERGQADVQAIGASAVNQAVKAIAIARGYLKEDGLVIACVPYFVEVRIGDNDRTAIRITVSTTDTLEKVMLASEAEALQKLAGESVDAGDTGDTGDTGDRDLPESSAESFRAGEPQAQAGELMPQAMA